MRKEMFLTKRKSKIMPRSKGPFEILEQIGPNTYKVDHPGDYGISAAFNVADLRPYFDENEEIPSLRSNSIQLEEDDGDHLSQPLETHSNAPSPVMKSSLVKGVQVLVKNMLNSPDSGLVSSSGKWRGFVCLVELQPEG